MMISDYNLEIVTVMFVLSSLYLDFINQFNNEDIIKDVMKVRMLLTIFYIILILLNISK